MSSEKQNTNERQPGMPCPSCNKFILISVDDLLFKPEVKCPFCLLELKLNRALSEESIQALQQLNTAVKNLEAVREKYHTKPTNGKENR